MIIRKNAPIEVKKDKPVEKQPQKIGKAAPKPREAGLGRGLDSLLDDNSPEIWGKPQVVLRGEAEDKRIIRESRDNLYKKEGAISYVKTPKRSRS